MGNTVDLFTYHLNYSKSSKFKNYSDIYSKGFISNINSQIIRFVIILTKGYYQNKKILSSKNLKISNCSITNHYNNWFIFIHAKDIFIKEKWKKKKRFKKKIYRKWKLSIKKILINLYRKKKKRFKKKFRIKFFTKKLYLIRKPKPKPKPEPEVKKVPKTKEELRKEQKKKVLEWLKKSRERKIRREKLLLLQNSKSYRLQQKIKKSFKNIFLRILVYLNFLYFKLPMILSLKTKIRNFILINFFKFKFKNFFNAKIFFSLGLNITPTASLVSLFIAKKLIHQYTLDNIFKKCFSYLESFFNRELISGFKILVSGRISRKDRATYSWKKLHKNSISSKFSAINYSKRLLKMRYGTSNIKVWIQQ